MIASVTYPTSGSAGPFTITYPYLEQSDIEVYLDGVLNTAWTISGVTQLTLNTAPTATNIEIRRNTQDDPYVDFSAPAPITPENLDTATLQAIYIAQEAKDGVSTLDGVALQLDSTGTYWDALSKRIKNVQTPDAPTDAVTRAYADAITTGAGNLPTIVNPTDDNKFLRALSGAASWVTFLAAMISDATTVGKNLLTAATAAAARTVLGSTAVGDALFIAADAASGRTTLVAAKQYTPVTLTAGTPVAVDASLGDYFKLTANTSFTLSNPTNPTNGQRIVFRILQDGTGGRVLTFDTKYRLGTDLSAVVLSTAGNKTDYIGCVYDSVADKWDVLAFIKGF